MDRTSLPFVRDEIRMTGIITLDFVSFVLRTSIQPGAGTNSLCIDFDGIECAAVKWNIGKEGCLCSHQMCAEQQNSLYSSPHVQPGRDGI